MELDDKLCYCFHVSRRKVLNHIRIHQPRVPSQISECGGAGTGCGWCVPFLKKCFETVRTGESAQSISIPEDYAQQRAAYIRAGRGTPAAGAEPLPEDGSTPSGAG